MDYLYLSISTYLLSIHLLSTSLLSSPNLPTSHHYSSMEPPSGPLGLMDPESITESIQNCHVSMEESRRRLMPLVSLLDDDDDGNAIDGAADRFTDEYIVQEFTHCIEQTFGAVDKLVGCLADCGLITFNNQPCTNGEESDVYLLMASNCIAKACEFITSHYMKLADGDSHESSGPLDDRPESDGEVKIQACMARLAELTLRLIHMQTTLIPIDLNGRSNDEDNEFMSHEEIIEAYAEYQRRCLRSRSKPSITSLAELRRVASGQNCFVSDIVEQERLRQQLESGLHVSDENDGEDDLAANGVGNVSRGQPHAQSVTMILGEASSLIQPLAAWRDVLPKEKEATHNESESLESWLHMLCQDAMNTLDNEAQTLAVTVGSWFGPDQRGLTALEQSPDASNSEALDLVSMEAALEEMAFMCQVLSRYCSFSQNTVVMDATTSSGSNARSKLHNLLTEQSLRYSTLETRLASLQFNQAFALASPQLIELGRPSLKVPSIVEDAHFVCVRAIERATGTRSERAVWTVGHWVCEIWGLNQSDARSVYRALMDGIGCNESKDGVNSDSMIPSSTKSGNSFAASLLEAVDGDIGTPAVGQSTASPPLSGGILWGKGNNEQSLQSKVDAELCALNGIHSAANACSALSGLFADLIEERLEGDNIGNGVVQSKASMLTFAREELSSHSCAYNNLLEERVRALVFDLCGADDLFDCDGKLCLQNLRLFVERELYNLDASSFKAAEGDERLEAEIVRPIRESQIFDEVGKDKCDVAVVLRIAEVSLVVRDFIVWEVSSYPFI